MKFTAFFVATLGVSVYMSTQLYKMSQIRGWIPGGIVSVQTVKQKWNDSSGAGAETLWISWTTADISVSGGHRINVTMEYWNNTHIGDQIQIVRFAGDRQAYLPDGMYASNGNFIFDSILLIVAVCLTVSIIILIIEDPEHEHRR